MTLAEVTLVATVVVPRAIIEVVGTSVISGFAAFAYLVLSSTSMGTGDVLYKNITERYNSLMSQKKADDLISPTGKRSPSYDPNYGDYTMDELEKLAKQGNAKARGMKKLAQQSDRLLDKVKNSKKR